jgi:putative flippase GtrA
MTKEIFRYAICGGFNSSLDIFLYFLCYNFVLNKQIVYISNFAISGHVAAFLIVFPITFSTGFLLSKYITFTESEVRGRIQLLRYGFTVLICILLNYFLLKLFVDLCGLYPTPSKIIITFVVAAYSFFSQRHFTFKTASAYASAK